MLLVRTSITIAFLAGLLAWLDTAQLVAAVGDTGVSLWLLVVGLHVVAHVGQALKWRLLITAAGSRAALGETIRAYGAGLCANTWLPSIIGGDVVRMGIVARNENDLHAAITGGVVERLTDVAALIMITGVGVSMFPAVQIGRDIGVTFIASIAIFLGVAGSMAVLGRLNPERFPSRIGRVLAGVQDALGTMRRRKLTSFLALVIAILMQTFLVFQNVLLGNAMGIEISIGVWLAVWPLSKLIALVPVSLGGLGVRQGALAALLVPFSVAPSLAVAQSLVWQTAIYAVGLLGGLMWLWSGYAERGGRDVAAGESHVL
jgi:hypothetical protein